MKIQFLILTALLSLIGNISSNMALAETSTATGLCKDGTPYTGLSKKGACKGHKGVKEWYADSTSAAKDTSSDKATKANPPVVSPQKAVSNDTAAATGLCKDGTSYTGASKKGACKGHKGIKEWFADSTPAAKESAATETTKNNTVTPQKTVSADSTGATGLCKDGTYYTGATKQGACRGHKGIKEWYADTAPAAKEHSTTPAEAKTNPPPAEKPANSTAAAAPAAGGGAGKVWVNDDSKLYHCPGSQFYGKTKSGAYMTESEALATGNNPAYGKSCK